MTEIAHRQSTQVMPRMDINAKVQYAHELAKASLLPRQYQQNPGNVLLAVELGESLGIPAIQAIHTVHVIEGKPSASSALISALVRRAGHKLRVTGNDQSATAEITRSDDPDFTYSATWDMGRANRAGITGKANWKKYPAAMLKARAITEVARDACQEALMGVQYTPEELGAIVDDEGNPVQGGIAPMQQADAHAPSGPIHGAENAPRQGGRFGMGGNFGQGQPVGKWDRLNNAFARLSITTPDDKRGETQQWATEQGLDREISSVTDLTPGELEAFTQYLENIDMGAPVD